MQKWWFIPLIIAFFLPQDATGNEIDSLLSVLEETMHKRDFYVNLKENKIRNIKNLLDENTDSVAYKYSINNRLIEEYSAYSFDSIFSYINRNQEIANLIGNPVYITACNLHLASLLASSGRYKEAEDILNKMDRSLFDKDLLTRFYQVFIKIYSDLDYFSFRSEYREKYLAFTDSLLPLLDENSDDYLYIMEWDYRSKGLWEDCKRINSQRLAMADMGTEAYSYITFQRGLIYEFEGNRDMLMKYLILSAISDIQGARKDNASLTKLALLIYEDNQIERAYEYIKFSFEDAIFYNSKLRFMEIANVFSVITEAYEIKSDKQRQRLKKLLIIISVLSVVLLFAIFFLYRQMNKLRSVRNDLRILNDELKQVNYKINSKKQQLEVLYEKLSESNIVKEIYIGNFMKICSDFIDKLDQYRSMVKKMVLEKHYEELFEITKTKDLIDNEISEFYKTFDSTFLNIYPDFCEKVNQLLENDGQIELKKGEILNTELRILALIRLGIKDSAKIAHLLRYSVNTIYNYRVKLKNRAKGSRENFEVEISGIGTFEKLQ